MVIYKDKNKKHNVFNSLQNTASCIVIALKLHNIKLLSLIPISTMKCIRYKDEFYCGDM